MPVISFGYEDFLSLLGVELSLDELRERLFYTKCDWEGFEDGEISVEVPPDRIDSFSVEGLARMFKGLLGRELGIPNYAQFDSGIKVLVDRSVNEVRPYIATAVIRNVNLNDEVIRQLMQLQEKLHVSWCRDRRKASIGVYDLDALKPPIHYAALPPNEIKFVPLDETEIMNGKEILEKTEKGRIYGHIISKFKVYPLVYDSVGTILSLPPIINSEDTRVTEETKNLFIDVTSTDPWIGMMALNVMCVNIAERCGEIGLTKVEYWNREVEAPQLKASEWYLNPELAVNITGLNLSPEKIVGLLRRSRMEAEVSGDGRIRVLVPSYRADVLHEIDLVEDVAIAYGFDRIEPETPEIYTVGRRYERKTLVARDIMVGLGFQEIYSYIMINKGLLFDALNRRPTKVVEVEKPISAYNVLRDTILPCLLEFLSANRHVEYPQKIFEVGEVVPIEDNSPRVEIRLAAAICDYSVGFEDIQASLFAFFKAYGIKDYRLKADVHPTFLEGRCAKIIIGEGEAGVIGEIHPQVLVNLGLENPVAAFEVKLMEVNRVFPQ